MRIKSLSQLVIINFKNFFREPGAIFWSFVFPVAMAWVLGLAFSGTPEKNYKILLQGDSTRVLLFPQEKLDTFSRNIGDGTGITVRARFEKADAAHIDDALRKSESVLYIDVVNGIPVFHYDPGNEEAVKLYLMLERDINSRLGKRPFQTAQITTKGIRYIDFLIPGLLAMGIMNSCVWGISWYLIELRMKKLLRRLVATPMKKSEFILSHFITRLLLSIFESLVLLIFSWILFGLEITGSVAALALLYVAGVVAFGGTGLLLASRTQSTHVGNGLINAVVLPMTIVSGIFFSYQSFPQWVIPIIKILPLTLLCDAIRAIFNQGAGLNEVMIPAIALSSMGILFYFIGLKLFKWY